MSNHSNFLQVPGPGASNPGGIAAPETPRNPRTSGLVKHTPTFSFGLSFLPSFNFNSPLQTVSPHKFIQSSSSENFGKIIKNDRKPSICSGSTPKSSRSFLDSLASSSRKRSNPDSDEASTIKDDMDMWSSLGNDSNSHNLTSLTSIYEKSADKENFDSSKDFLTPSKLTKKIVDSESSIDSKFVDLTNKPNKEFKPLYKSNSDKKINQKKRKLSNSITDSPNNIIATQIALSVVSPISKRILSNSKLNLLEHEDKVWYPDLDDILINAFLKYRQFKDNHGFASSSVLANTSQNKVLSWMLLHKTGLSRTSKQIASRLFRLAKSKRLNKPSKSKTTNAQSLDEIHCNPFDDSLNSTGIQSMESLPPDDIDRELDLILSSPINDNDNVNPASKFSFAPTVCSLTFSKEATAHSFTTLDPVYQDTFNFDDLSQNLLPSIKQFTESMQFNCPSAQGWIVDHSINMDFELPRQIATSTPISPFPNQYHLKSINISDGSFKSYMQLEVNCQEKIANSPSMLQWKSLCQIYNGNNSQIHESCDIINGYKLEGSKYEFQIPFMKNFFLGYFHFLINGGNPKEMDLCITQVLYELDPESKDFDPKNSSVTGYFIHRFKAGKGTSTFKKIQYKGGLSVPEKDDNETVLAYSSPYRPSPQSFPNDSPSKGRMIPLSIDTNQANNYTSRGPMTAPVYNSNIVSRKLVKEQVNIQQLPKDPNLILHTYQRPPEILNQSKSTNNIPQFIANKFNETGFPVDYNNATAAVIAAHPATSTFHSTPNLNQDTNLIPPSMMAPMTNMQSSAPQFMPVHKQTPYQPPQFVQHNIQPHPTRPDQFSFEQVPMYPGLVSGHLQVYQIPQQIPGQQTMNSVPLYPTNLNQRHNSMQQPYPNSGNGNGNGTGTENGNGNGRAQ